LDRLHAALIATEPFRGLSEEEEALHYDFLEKFVLSKLHPYTFAKSSELRRRDRKVAKHLRFLQFLKLKHFEMTVPADMCGDADGSDVDRLLEDAISSFQKLETMNNTVNKLVCISTSCKILMEFLKKIQGAGGADDFFTLLVYTLLRASPNQLCSNIDYIETYRTPWRRNGESEYHFTSYVSAATFLQELSVTNAARLCIGEAEFAAGYRAAEETYWTQRRCAAGGAAGGTGSNTAGGVGHGLVGQTVRHPPQGGGGGGGGLRSSNIEVEQGKLRNCTLRFRDVTDARDLRIGEVQALLDEYRDMSDIIADLKIAFDLEPQQQMDASTES